MNKINIRTEKENDFESIKTVNDIAFGQSNEGILVNELRKNPHYIKKLSIVAEVDGKIIGHILFFPIKINHESVIHHSLALAPMSVIPEFQRKGVGKMLIKKGLEISRELGFKSVIVLGHSEYYTKFGFSRASKWDIKAHFDIPDEVFMALELIPGGLEFVSGTVEYPEEFDEVS